mmetsp:Transcript_56007/g.175755  ORF Transcript_56007/g.175755 Transcript_56007/m.175755 type:complete len:251 (-) Transcript_56007:1642-2394(-)
MPPLRRCTTRPAQPGRITSHRLRARSAVGGARRCHGKEQGRPLLLGGARGPAAPALKYEQADKRAAQKRNCNPAGLVDEEFHAFEVRELILEGEVFKGLQERQDDDVHHQRHQHRAQKKIHPHPPGHDGPPGALIPQPPLLLLPRNFPQELCLLAVLHPLALLDLVLEPLRRPVGALEDQHQPAYLGQHGEEEQSTGHPLEPPLLMGAVWKRARVYNEGAGKREGHDQKENGQGAQQHLEQWQLQDAGQD